MVDPSVGDLIREVTKPEVEDRSASKSAARNRLLAAAEADAGRLPGKRLRLGRRGLAAIIALLVVPGGVAAATELVGDGEQTFVELADCPEVLAGVEERGLSVAGLMLADCPVGAQVEQTLALIGELEERRAKLEANGGQVEGIAGFGRSADGEAWSLEGIAGEDDRERER